MMGSGGIGLDDESEGGDWDAFLAFGFLEA